MTATPIPDLIASLDDPAFDAVRIAWTHLLVDLAVIEAQVRVAAARAVLDGIAVAR